MHFDRSRTPSRTLVVTALAITWLAWGSSFIAIHWANAVMPPLLMMATRFVAAGLLVAGLRLASRTVRTQARCTRGVLLDAVIVGAGMVTVGMGLTGWAANRLDSGIAALIMATVPVWMAAFAAAAFGHRPHRIALVGIVVGLAGIGALMTPGQGDIDLVAIGALVIANAAWAGASLFATRAASTGDGTVDTGLRMLVGGGMLVAISGLSGELRGFDVGAIDARAAASWAYLVVLCSVIAFVAYEWLVRNTSSTLASTHAFVNPAVAVALGVLILGERITTQTVIAGIGIVGAVTLLVIGERRMSTATSSIDAPAAPAAVTVQPVNARTAARGRRVARTPMPGGRVRTGLGFDATPTPAFAARRSERPWAATDGMDALAIDVALDRSI